MLHNTDQWIVVFPGSDTFSELQFKIDPDREYLVFHIANVSGTALNAILPLPHSLATLFGHTL